MNTMDTAVMHENLDNAVYVLREDRRIKRGTDYNYTVKYGQIHVMCQAVYLESVKEVFENYDLTAEYITY